MAPAAAALMARELGRDEAWQAREVRAFQSLADRYLLGPAEPRRA
jgi:glycerol-3-phosphate dehydrogenase